MQKPTKYLYSLNKQLEIEFLDNAIYNNIKIIEYLGTNLAKEIQKFYTKNDRTLLREILMMLVISKQNYRFYMIQIKSSRIIFVEIKSDTKVYIEMH